MRRPSFALGCSDTSGSVAVIFALLLLPLVGMAGAAVDYARLTHSRATLRAVADAAALAGAGAMLAKESSIASALESAGVQTATKVAEGMAPTSRSSITASAITRSITVSVTRTEQLFFSGFVGRNSNDVTAESTAVFQVEKDCFYVMDNSGTSLFLNATSKLSISCGLRVNSAGSPAVSVNSNAKIQASAVCTVGSVNNIGGIQPAPKTGCPGAVDPLAAIPEPAQATNACDYDTDVVVNSGQSRTLSPGVYCKKVEANGGTITFSPGIYVLRGLVKANSSGRMVGTDVMLFFGGKEGRLELTSDSSLELSGRKSGAHRGIVIFQSRDPSTLEAGNFELNSSTGMKLIGAVYMPNGVLRINSSSSATTEAAWTAFVVRRAELASSSVLTVNAAIGSDPPAPAGLEGVGSGDSVRLTK